MLKMSFKDMMKLLCFYFTVVVFITRCPWPTH